MRSAVFSQGAFAPRIPPWQRSAMHRTRNADYAGAAPAGGSLSNGGRDVTASIRSCEDRRAGAAPVGLPISKKRAMPKSSRRRLANPLLPGASPGARSISGPSSNSKTTQWHCVDRGATPRGSTFFIGHEEDSNPRRSDRRGTRGGTEVPDHFKIRQSVGSDARRWYRRETGATPVGGSYCPVAQTARAPGSDPGG